MNTILVIWTIVGYAGTQFSTHEKYDWRPIGEFSSPTACVKAAADLGIVNPKQFRCLKKGD
jgi:hypothetical protein